MNYELHYNKLIDRARRRLLEGYCERHHIVPRCMGGSDDVENIAVLTAREHYVAHQLLVKLYPDDHNLAYAAKMMTVDSNGGRVGNRLYEWIKIRCAKVHSERMKGNKCAKGSVRSKETKDLLSKINFANPPKGHLGHTHSDSTKAHWSKIRKGKIWIHKEDQETQIKKSELEIYLADNWVQGRVRLMNISWMKRGPENHNYGRKFITNGIETKCVDANCLLGYLDSGWVRGRKIKEYK